LNREKSAFPVARLYVEMRLTLTCLVNRTIRPRRAAGAAVAIGFCCCMLPDSAAAHITSTGSGGFGSGFAHPLTGPDHFLAMFAVGLWDAQMGGRPVWTLPVTFPLIMVAGGAAGMFGLPVPTANQIRVYWWCSPPRIGRQRMRPTFSAARDIGASLCNDKCVRVTL
jgi:HupE / UreJ protein